MVASLRLTASKTLYQLLSTGSTQEDRKSSRHVCKIVYGHKASKQASYINNQSD